MTTWTIGWWTQAERDRAAKAVCQALRDWAEQWGADEVALHLDGVDATHGDFGVASWLRVTGSGDRDGVWLTHPDAIARELGAALCDDARDLDKVARHVGPVSQAVARRAACALAAALCTHFDWSKADADAACVLPDGLARGGLTLSLSVAGALLTVVFSAGMARAVTGRMPDAAASLIPLPHVIGRRSVTLAVTLRSIRLDIGSLCSLTVGDVIALDHKLDEPVALLAGDGSQVADAHLAKIGPSKAIRLGRAAP